MHNLPDQFPPLRDWDHLVERLSASDITEPEAIGLLYAGPQIEGDPAAKTKRIKFYIHCATYNTTFGRVAAQVIVKQWMSSTGSLEPAAHRLLIGFLLAIDQEVLAQAPYPGFIQEYLGKLWNGLESRSGGTVEL